MNKKASSVFEESLKAIGIFVVLALLIWFGIYLKEQYSDYKEYKEFCEERSDFCYCSLFEGGCEFKLQWNSQDGPSKDVLELCELANKLNDKEMIFKAGCD